MDLMLLFSIFFSIIAILSLCATIQVFEEVNCPALEGRACEHGLTYIGGTQKSRVSLHSLKTGKRVTWGAKISDCQILTRISWRGTLLSGLKAGISATHAPRSDL